MSAWLRGSRREVGSAEVLDLLNSASNRRDPSDVPELRDARTVRMKTASTELEIAAADAERLQELVKQLFPGGPVDLSRYEVFVLEPRRVRRLTRLRRLLVLLLAACGIVACVGDSIESGAWRAIGVGAIFVGICAVAAVASLSVPLGVKLRKRTVDEGLGTVMWTRFNSLSLPRRTLEVGLSSGHMLVVRSPKVGGGQLVDAWATLVATDATGLICGPQHDHNHDQLAADRHVRQT